MASVLIQPVRLGDEAAGVHTRIFDVDTLDAFLRGLSAGAETIGSERPGACGITAAARRANRPVEAIVGKILAGEFGWIGSLQGLEGYAAIRVRVSEARRGTGDANSDVLTPPEVGEEIGIGQKRASALIAAGLITSRRASGVPGGRRPRLVTRREVSRFRETYVTLG